MERIIIITAFLLNYYNICGLATTNILRLTADGTLKVNSSKCFCGNCGGNIPPILQFPIVSYIVCKGRCRLCGAKIPVFQLLLEIIIFVGMTALTAAFGFSPMGVVYSFLFYEIVRFAVILIKGKRRTGFVRQYFAAAASMIPFLLFSLFVSALYGICGFE